MGALSVWHWAIVLIALVLLFGSKRLPDAARGVGRSLRIFKSEIKEMTDDGQAPAAQPAAPVQLPAATAPAEVAQPVVAPQVVTPQVVTPQAAAPQSPAPQAAPATETPGS